MAGGVGNAEEPLIGKTDDQLIKDTTTAGFMADVIEGSRDSIVLVDFWAPWCGPCRQLTPVLEKCVREAGGTVKLVKMNIDEHPTIPGQMGVQSIPTVFAFKDGKPVDGFQGAQTESQIRDFINRLGGNSAEAELEQRVGLAKEQFEAGNVPAAAGIYGEILQQNPQYAPALAGLANCYLQTNDLERAEQTIALVQPDDQSSPEITAVRAAIELARKAGSAGDISELRAKVTADPADLQARYDLAVALGASGDRSGAVEQLIEVMRRDRNWNDEAARKQLLQFFEVWGHGDPDTVSGRRQLSSLLFS
ncbi:MAG TPA: thioredoxin [Chromatiales bacterium]|nr:thioredoxin [Chromatiales bacterium]